MKTTIRNKHLRSHPKQNLNQQKTHSHWGHCSPKRKKKNPSTILYPSLIFGPHYSNETTQMMVQRPSPSRVPYSVSSKEPFNMLQVNFCCIVANMSLSMLYILMTISLSTPTTRYLLVRCTYRRWNKFNRSYYER